MVAPGMDPNGVIQLDHGASIPFLAATFGPRRDVSGFIQHTDPPFADTALSNAQAIKGAIAVVWRGKNKFGEKCRRVQRAGAVGIVLANTVEFDFVAKLDTKESRHLPATLCQCQSRGTI